MNMIRANKAPDLLECFWESQIRSKEDVISALGNGGSKNIYIFGGWYGLLSALILDEYPSFAKHIYNIDINPICEQIGPEFTGYDSRITFVTADMATYQYTEADVVINTSTEHVSQETYDAWFDRIPKMAYVALQGCDLVHEQHIRPMNDIAHFLKCNRIQEIKFVSMKTLDVGFTRFCAYGIR